METLTANDLKNIYRFLDYMRERVQREVDVIPRVTIELTRDQNLEFVIYFILNGIVYTAHEMTTPQNIMQFHFDNLVAQYMQVITNKMIKDIKNKITEVEQERKNG